MIVGELDLRVGGAVGEETDLNPERDARADLVGRREVGDGSVPGGRGGERQREDGNAARAEVGGRGVQIAARGEPVRQEEQPRESRGVEQAGAQTSRHRRIGRRATGRRKARQLAARRPSGCDLFRACGKADDAGLRIAACGGGARQRGEGPAFERQRLVGHAVGDVGQRDGRDRARRAAERRSAERQGHAGDEQRAQQRLQSQLPAREIGQRATGHGEHAGVTSRRSSQAGCSKPMRGAGAERGHVVHRRW